MKQRLLALCVTLVGLGYLAAPAEAAVVTNVGGNSSTFTGLDGYFTQMDVWMNLDYTYHRLRGYAESGRTNTQYVTVKSRLYQDSCECLAGPSVRGRWGDVSDTSRHVRGLGFVSHPATARARRS